MANGAVRWWPPWRRRRLAELATIDAAWDEDEPRRQFSPWRVAVALVAVGAIAYGGQAGIRARVDAASAPQSQTFFAPYVDVTLTPTYSFQNHADAPARQVALGFVVSQPRSPCTPSWGAVDTLPQADQSLALGPRIAELTREGAGAIVSFGGQAHTDLAVACHDVAALTNAYREVVSAYHLRLIDLDIEGQDLNDLAATNRRVAAIRALEAAARQHHRQLGVWLTLPVEPSGLQSNALSVIDAMLRGRVELAGINVMAMDFSHPPSSGETMLDEVEQACSAAEAQVAAEFQRYGVRLSAREVWRRMGVTVMIGQNDMAGERFTVRDGQGLVTFATRMGLGRVSIWSLNRDTQCGTAFAEIGVNSNTCSGTPEAHLAFARLFSRLRGTAPAYLGSSALPPRPDTNPANAPYPEWSPTASYQTGYRVVRQGYIYQAKWYNSGQDPAAQLQYSWQTPWELLGPVLPSDRAPTLTTVPPGTYPAWSQTAAYVAGDRVVFNGLAYQAKWANQGASPADQASDPGGSPWQPLFSIPGEPSSS